MKRKSRESGESLLPPSITRNESSPADTPRPLRHRRGTSAERRTTKQHVPMSSTVVCSPKMIPAITPISTTAPPRTSPLLTPMIPLHPPPEMLTPIAGTPVSPPETAQGLHKRTRSATYDSHVTRTPSVGHAKEDYFSIRTRQPSMSDETPTPGPVSAGGVHGGAGAKSEPPSTPNTPGGIMGRLKVFGKMGRRPASESASPNLGDITPTIAAVSPMEVSDLSCDGQPLILAD
jgi:WD repeat-containing protein 48